MWNSYMLAVLSWVISLIWKSEDKEQAHSWVGDHRDAVEKVVSLLMLIPNPHPSGTAESTALLTQNVLWELGGGTHLQIHILIIWRSIWSSIWCQTFTTLTRMIYVTLELLEGFTPSFTHFLSVYYLMLCAKKPSPRYNTQAVEDCTLLWSPLSA